MKNHKFRFLSGLIKTVSAVTIVSITSKILGLLREMGIASYFGVGVKTDAFYVALIIPALLFTSIGTAIQNLFMIEFTAVKNDQDKTKENRLASNVSNILLVVSSLVFIISFIFTPAIIKVIAPGFVDPEKFNLTVKLTRILLPTMIILPVYQIRASILRVNNKFVTVAIIDLGFNIFQILYLLLFADKFGIEGLVYSVLFAYLFQLIVIELVAYRIGFRNKVVLDFNDRHWKTILKLFFPTFVSFGIIQINATVDKIIASNLGDGAISALNYGFMIRNVLYTVIISTILLVIYPILLKHKNNNDVKSYNAVGKNTFHTLWAIALPITIILMLFSESIVRILFERGEFSTEATLLTSGVLFYYAIGIAFYALKEFLVHICFSQKNTKLPLVVTTIGAVLNIIFSVILKQWMGVNGIALGLAIAEIISVCVIIIYTQKLGYLNLFKAKKDTIIIFVINIIIGGLLFITLPHITLPSNKLMELVYLIIIGLSVLVIYVLALIVGRVSFIRDFIHTIRSGEDAN